MAFIKRDDYPRAPLDDRIYAFDDAVSDVIAKMQEAQNGLKSRIAELEAAKPPAPSRRRRQGDGDAPSGGA